MISLVLLLKIFLPQMLRNQLISNGNLLLKTDVYISSINIKLNGSLNIKGIIIKNPSNFSQDNFLKLENLSLKIKPETFFSETIYVENVNFRDANILVEINDKMQINITELSKRINTPKKITFEKPESSKFEKKFIVENFSITNPILLLSAKNLSIRKNYKLPALQIRDIGVKENGIYPEEFVTGLLARISEESKKYTQGLTKGLKENFSKKKNKFIDDINKEEKKLKGIADDIKKKLKGFDIE